MDILSLDAYMLITATMPSCIGIRDSFLLDGPLTTKDAVRPGMIVGGGGASR